MLTIFATPKPFRGHEGVIQRNAIGSWVPLHPECEVLLFGDEPGAAEIAQELGVRHVPGVRRSEFGTKRLDHIFARAQEMARHDILCHANCDIILLPCCSWKHLALPATCLLPVKRARRKSQLQTDDPSKRKAANSIATAAIQR